MLRRSRQRLVARYLDSWLSENKVHIPSYYTKDTVLKEGRLLLASASREYPPGPKITFYLGSISRMFDERLERVVTHEIAHLKGANEKQAIKAESKETPRA